MKNILSLVLLASMSFSAIAQDVTRTSLPIGSELPKKTENLPDAITGKLLPGQMKGNGLLVVFSCNTCPYVLKSLPRMKEMLEYAAKNDVGVLVLNANEAQRDDADAPQAMKKFGEDNGYPNYCIDKAAQLADVFGASRTPEVFLFNKDKKLVYKGAMDDNVPEPENAKEIFLRNAIDNMIAGKEIKPAETKSVGCSIKRI